MHQTHELKKTGIRFKLSPRKRGVYVPIGVQVTQAALAAASRNNKRRTRNKGKTWQKEGD